MLFFKQNFKEIPFISDHQENKEALKKNILQQLFKRISLLLHSSNEEIQIEAGNA